MSKPPKGARELPPEGNHKAVLVYAIQLGTQPNKNPKFEDANKIQLGFELVGRKKKSGEPFIIATKYTFSQSPKSNLAKMLKKWQAVKNPGEHDLVDDLGKSAVLTIEHSEDGEYANITEVEKCGVRLKAETKPYSLFLDETFDQDVFDGLWDKIKEVIASSPEYDEVASGARKSKKKKR